MQMDLMQMELIDANGMDKQQDPTVYHRKPYPIFYNKPWRKKYEKEYI